MADLTGAFMSMGNPLLDIAAEVEKDTLDKYELAADNAIMAEPKHLPLYQELVDKFPVQYYAGGAAQNTARVVQWMLQVPGATVYTGCVGTDHYAADLTAAATRDNVHVPYMKTTEYPTGSCAVLISNEKQHRSLVANLGAAAHFKPSHFETEEMKAIIAKARMYYVEGYFIASSHESIQYVAQHSAANGKIFAMNFSAPFLSQFFRPQLLETLKLTDIIIGNESEYETFAKENKLTYSNLEDVVKQVAAWEKTSGKPRLAICTQASNPTIAVVNGELTTYPVRKVEKIVDTNGCGDAFVGGFLSEYLKGSSMQKCMDAGHYGAWVIIQQIGVSFPTPKPDWV